MDLISLRWNFNTTNIEIHSFYPDDDPTTRTSLNAAFLYVELISVTQSSNPVFGNFTSILTVDLSELQQQHISLIRCGDPGTFEVLPVSIQINQISIPQDPQMLIVHVSFDSSKFAAVLSLSWNLSVSLDHIAIIFVLQ